MRTATAPKVVAPQLILPSPTTTPDPVLHTLEVIVPGSIDTLDPLTTAAAAGRALDSLLFPRLLQVGTDGRFRPALASSWSAPTPTSLLFHLECGLHWSDGVAITSDDVRFSISAAQLGEYRDESSGIKAALTGLSVTAPDACSVLVSGQKPLTTAVLAALTFPIVPAHIARGKSDAALRLTSFGVVPVSGPPFRVVRASVLQVKLRNTAGGSWSPREVAVCFEEKACASNPQAVVQIDSTGGAVAPMTNATVQMLPEDRPVSVFFNVRGSVVSDPVVRQALSAALSRRQFVQQVLGQRGVPLLSPLAPWFWAFDPAREVPDAAPGRVVSLLGGDGWSRSSKGVWVRDGRPLTVVLLTTPDTRRLEVANAIATAWVHAGIDAQVEQVGLDGLMRDFVIPGHFQAALLGVAGDGASTDLAALWGSGGALNISGISDPTLDAAIGATQSLNPSVERQGFEQFQQRFEELLPALPIYLPAIRVVSSGAFVPAIYVRGSVELLASMASWRASQ
ncbi:MAG: ABC transporter substrate-binding protein [Chloroflexi bacterium]|nr:ABC transporter substrate-binding protein [Chloroflexota bacterium]